MNPDLISVYGGIKRDWLLVERLLREHHANHGKRYYYKQRRSAPADPAARAARMLYLNRTCFNGIYRVNRQGLFNVPKGTRNAVVLDTDDFEGIATLLRTAKLRVSDFEPLIDCAGRDDLVFADPPYTVQHNHNAFIKYNEKLFSWEDQVRLAEALQRARARGAKIVATNANHSSIRKLYRKQGFALRTVTRPSCVSGDATFRSACEEVVILANSTRE